MLETEKILNEQALAVLKEVHIENPTEEQIEVALSFVSTVYMLESERSGVH